MKKVTIPSGITKLMMFAFIQCEGLESITVDAGNTVYHSAGYCLINTEEKKLVLGCQNSVIPDDGSVTCIAKDAFFGCSTLTNISIPACITSIESSAFSYLPGLESISVAADNPVYHSAGNCLINTQVKTMVLGCKNSVIPDDGSVTSIGISAFRGCTELKSILLPDSVTSIGELAFYDCTGLTELTIPSSVASIGWSAFNNCTALKCIVLPDDFSNVDYYTFECNAITEIIIPASEKKSNFMHCVMVQ